MKLAPAQARKFLSAPSADMFGALLYGPNRALVAEAAAGLAKLKLGASDDPFALSRLSEEELRRDKLKLAEALAAQSLLGGPRVAWARCDGESANEAILNALREIERGAPGGFLIVEGGDWGSKAKAVAAFEAATRAVSMAFYEETAAERAAFVRSLIEQAKLPLSADARDFLVQEAPPDRALARQEVEKVALFAHDLGRPVEIDDLRALFAYEIEGAVDEALAAALSGRLADALSLLDRIEGTNGISLLKALERKLLRLMEARMLVAAGAPVAEVGDRLKPKVFWKEREAFAAQVRLWTAPKLLAALEALAVAEIRAKTAGAPQIEIAAALYAETARRARA